MNRCNLLGLIAVLLLPVGSHAHRMPEGLTTLSYNSDTGNTEIIHRLHVHDAELGLAENLQNPQFTLGTLEAQARLALYVEQRFRILNKATGEPLTLTLVGAELQGDYAIVFQEFPGSLPYWIAMRNDILRDIFPDQVNKVNVTIGSQLRTLMFSGKDVWKDLQMQP